MLLAVTPVPTLSSAGALLKAPARLGQGPPVTAG